MKSVRSLMKRGNKSGGNFNNLFISNMKRKTYFCISLCMLSVTLSLWNCTDTELVKNDTQVQHKNFSLEEAKGFFEKQMQRSFVSTRSSNGKKPKQLVTPGDFIPQWDKAVASTKAGLSCYDIPIDNDIHYKAMYSTYKNGKAKAWITNVYQKLIVVKNQSTGNLGTYILNLIPDAQYDKKNLKEVTNRFINCADKGGFSGIAFYTIPNLNRIIRVNRYENGIKKQGVFLSGKREQMEEKMAIAHELLKNIVLKGKKKVTTRSYGEDDYWDDFYWDDDYWDDDYWDDDGSNDNNSSIIDDWINDGGMVIELLDGWIFIDENGDSFIAEDSDGDGEPDTVIIMPGPDDDDDDDDGNGNGGGSQPDTGYEDPDSEDDNNQESESAQESGIDNPNNDNKDDQRPKDEQELKVTLNEINPILNKLGIDIKEYKIQLNKDACLTNARTLPDNTIEVCTQFFDYTTNERASILWHEIYHINSEHNQAPTISNIHLELSVPPENILNGINAYIEWINKDITPEFMGLVKEDYLKNMLIEDNAKNIQWYENEVETYNAEKNNGLSRSDYYEGLLDFMQWKYEQVVLILGEK